MTLSFFISVVFVVVVSVMVMLVGLLLLWGRDLAQSSSGLGWRTSSNWLGGWNGGSLVLLLLEEDSDWLWSLDSSLGSVGSVVLVVSGSWGLILEELVLKGVQSLLLVLGNLLDVLDLLGQSLDLSHQLVSDLSN